MPDMGYLAVKKVLLQVKDMCQQRTQCGGCPFDNEKTNNCPITERPDLWDIDDWREETK